MNHIKEIEAGHEYQIIDRSTGEFGTSCSLKFIKIMGDEVVHGGAFTQDVLEALAARVKWQLDTQKDDSFGIRTLPLVFINLAIKSYSLLKWYREWKYGKLIGHEFD
jgi:hypothetical protein